MAKVYDLTDPKSPFFPSRYSVLKSDVLHFTDLAANVNKFYGMEIHEGKENGNTYYRIYTTHGKTDELYSEGESKRKVDCRYIDTPKQASILYDLIYKEKTQKGYEVISLASNTVGSSKESKPVRDIEAELFMEDKEPLSPEVRELVHYLYSEASLALKERIAGKITDRGIETPLGILTLAQIEHGEKILLQISALLPKAPQPIEEITKLSGKFYSLIPHKIGQATNVLSTAFLIEEKQELLQTMKDLVSISESVSGKTTDSTKMQYRALRCSISMLPKAGAEFESIAQQTIVGSDGKISGVEAVYKINREVEHKNFTNKIFNSQLLFHGSHIGNWLGILSRGILLPKRVISMGVNRTDAGQLGYGIYFGSRSLTSSRYSTEGKKGTGLMALCSVALGNVYETQTSKWHFTSAPMNYHSCHGIPAQNGDFKEPHFAVYAQNQVRMEYLVEFVKREAVVQEAEEEEEPELALTRKNDTTLVTQIKELKKTSANWRIAVRVTYKTELLMWNTSKSRGNFFTADFIDNEKGRIHVISFKANAVKFFPQLEEDKTYEVSGGSIRDIHENFTSIKNELEMILDKNTTITPLETAAARNLPHLEVKFLPIHEIMTLEDSTVVDIIGLVIQIGEITEFVSKYGNAVPRRVLTLTCPPTFDSSTHPTISGVSSALKTDDFPTIQVSLWYKDATQLTFCQEDVVAVTKAQVSEYKGVRKLSTKHCSHHIYINPSAAQFTEVSAMNKWAAEWFNAQNRSAPTHRIAEKPPSSPTLSTAESTLSKILNNPTLPPSSLQLFSPCDVGQWLREHNLERYTDTFEQNEITGQILSQLTSEMLKTELGVLPFGHRFIIMQAFGIKKNNTWPPKFTLREQREPLPEIETPFEAPKKQAPPIITKSIVPFTNENEPIVPSITKRKEEFFQKWKAIPYTVSSNPEAHTITSNTPSAFNQVIQSRINVFDSITEMVRKELTATEKATSCTVFATPPPDFYTPLGFTSCVESIDVFRRNFAEYTRAQLSNFNWSNMIVAGGTIFTCLKRETNKNNMFTGPSRTGDIDIFLIGLDAAAAERKIHALYNHIKHTNNCPYIVVRTSFAISFVSEYPNRTIQVILRLYDSIEEVLEYFDLDCVTVAYDGSNVFALPRAVRAFNTRTNFVDVLRFQSQTKANDSRMIKYFRRGFGAIVVKNNTFENGGMSPSVTTKLAALHKKEDLTNPAKRKERQQIDALIADDPETIHEDEKKKETTVEEPTGEDGLPATGKGDKYEDVSFIPFGKDWNAEKIYEALKKKLKLSEDTHKAKGSDEPFVPFYIVGSFEEVMGLNSRAEFKKKWGTFPHKPQWNQGWA